MVFPFGNKNSKLLLFFNSPAKKDINFLITHIKKRTQKIGLKAQVSMNDDGCTSDTGMMAAEVMALHFYWMMWIKALIRPSDWCLSLCKGSVLCCNWAFIRLHDQVKFVAVRCYLNTTLVVSAQECKRVSQLTQYRYQYHLKYFDTVVVFMSQWFFTFYGLICVDPHLKLK